MSMLLQEKLYILCCLHASARDSEGLTKLLPYFNEQLTDAVVVLWPELDDPLALSFLCAYKTVEKLEINENVFVEHMANDQRLICILGAGDENALTERYSALKQYVDGKLPEGQLNWLQKRVILCNNFDPSDANRYSKLWETQQGDENLQRWINCLVKPLTHWNKRTGEKMRISEFSQLERRAMLRLIIDNWVTLDEAALNSELFPVLQNGDNFYQQFVTDFYNSEKFSLDSEANIRLFHAVFAELLQRISDGDNKALFETATLRIVFENSGNLFKYSTCSDLEERVLQKVSPDSRLTDYNVTVSDLLTYCQYLKNDLFPQDYTLKDVYRVAQDDSSAQRYHFITLCEMYLLKTAHPDLHILLQRLDLFNKLNDAGEQGQERRAILMETLIRLEKFDLLESILQDDDVQQLDILKNAFWQFFNNASNAGTREMTKAKTILRILKANSKAKEGDRFKQLTALVDLSEQLSHYSLKLGKQIPFKPSNILDFNDDPLRLFTILLELNPTLYKSLDTVSFPLLSKLLIALALPETQLEDFHTRLMALHVDFSLANNDFTFAYNLVLQLLERGNVSRYWSTVLQVGKYNDPNWVDNEPPTEIIILQLEVLSKLLAVCPAEEIEVVTSQWSGLELELSSRDIVQDQYSLENQSSLSHNFSLKDVSGTVSSLLTGFNR
ncbi:Sec39p KNAG_0B06580 [Huiozyma naganishii CBS 8797]|uniref:DED domain-containing protein n=1 Tax=Huiozyma naganishii (strain ATCC MYA-139 / BCRC 22969 / CBS 8797 / KCTC 17520 / NBRC 10181 / NCYC 3082 / Yp74L-3) TaxID=1071383 RepID=J7R2P0_HUIN7|nr:hypothetical protein KNAG_0B06580 [Kazachstania naganishii CBS 8797]CCK69085.1 hypothetical protein KNAG_0B06580 [Kazachstania naganishii CBS 8797]